MGCSTKKVWSGVHGFGLPSLDVGNCTRFNSLKFKPRRSARLLCSKSANSAPLVHVKTLKPASRAAKARIPQHWCTTARDPRRGKPAHIGAEPSAREASAHQRGKPRRGKPAHINARNPSARAHRRRRKSSERPLVGELFAQFFALCLRQIAQIDLESAH